jgi:hypothetical protein
MPMLTSIKNYVPQSVTENSYDTVGIFPNSAYDLIFR